MQEKKRTFTFKVITAGDGGVGKTTMLHRFVEGKFLTDTKITIGVGFYQKNVNFGGNDIYSLQLWDFGGEEHFRPFLDSYISGASGAFLMIDLTRMRTLERIGEWVSIIRKDDPNLPILFIGAKIDLVDKISVSDEDTQKLKEQYNFLDYLKVSSKTGYNVEQVFKILKKEILRIKHII